MVLPKSMRIKGYKCFDYIHKTSNKFNTNLMLLKVAKANTRLIKEFNGKNHLSNLRCAVSISNKVSKKAVVRNKIRRALHDHLKARLNNKPQHQKKLSNLS